MSGNKFRTKSDYSHWVFRYWQLVSGNFIPISYKKAMYYELQENNEKFIKNVEKGKYNMICINDSDTNLNFEIAKKEIINMFEKMYPNKSKFEK